MNRQRRYDAKQASGAAGDDLAEKILERMRENETKRPRPGVHIMGERGVRTWCNAPITPTIRIADRLADATCETCLELDQCRRIGIANGTYKHPLDLRLDAELGVRRPPTQGT